MIRAAVLVVLAGLAACGGASRPAASSAARVASKCPAVADQLLALITPADNFATEKADAMRRAFMERCEQDGWGAEAQQCFLGAVTMKDASDRCGPLLTEQQTSAFGAAVMAETKEGGAGTGAAPVPAQPEAAGDAPPMQPAPPSPKPTSAPPRAPRPKDTSDPCEGGE